MGELDKLIEISHYYGENPDYVIAGGGNTSYKDQESIWIKASGIPLAGINADGFVSLSREKLARIETAVFSEDPKKREEEVKEQMTESILAPKNLRPSVETSLHNLIDYKYVIHTHPTLVNALMCANDIEKEVAERFGDSAILVEYTDPGYILFKKLQGRIATYIEKYGSVPQIIFLQNHGVFVGADTVDDIKELYEEINLKISSGKDLNMPSAETIPYQTEITVAIRSYFASRSWLTRSVIGKLIRHFTVEKSSLELVSKAFSPDIIVYCKSKYLFLDHDIESDKVIGLIEQFEDRHGYYPKVILQEGEGLTVVEENDKSLQTVQDVFLDLMKISYLTQQFGGPHFMTPEQIRFIDNWEVEHYRRKIAKQKLE